MESYTYLLLLALILLSTKAFGLVTEKIHMPQVVGALLAGIILGPSGAGILHSTDFLVKTAEIGVIMVMFIAGIDTDLEELKKTGFQACVIAMMGVLVPLVLCGGAYFFFYEGEFTYHSILKAAFVGTVFAATSVGITVETLSEMGKLKSPVGSTLMAAALIDDIIGIVVLSVISGLSGGEDSPLLVLGRILLFFVFVFFVSLLGDWIFRRIAVDHSKSRRIAVWALAFCLLMAYCAEVFFGVADITGAYFAGLILCNVTKSRKFVAKRMTVASYMVFTPVFFASVGLSTDLSAMSGNLLVFALVLLACSVVSKVVGCGLAGRACGLPAHDSLAVGVGMVARGEVALMVAQKGIAAGMIDPQVLPAVVLCVIGTALATPILLKLVLNHEPAPAAQQAQVS